MAEILCCDWFSRGQKWDDLSSRGTLSTGLRPHGRIEFRTLLRITGTVLLHRTWSCGLPMWLFLWDFSFCCEAPSGH